MNAGHSVPEHVQSRFAPCFAGESQSFESAAIPCSTGTITLNDTTDYVVNAEAAMHGGRVICPREGGRGADGPMDDHWVVIDGAEFL